MADPLDDVPASIADGTPIDWAALDSRASSADARDLLAQLRVVADMASAHRLIDAPASADRTREATGGGHLPDLDLHHWGRYELLERLGRGTFGTVYRAWDPDLERQLAIKIIHPLEGVKDEIKTRVLNEGRAIAKVSHPNVVSVYGVEVHEGQVGLCMELVNGKTLDEIVRTQGKLGAQEAMMVGQSICRALSAVHGANLVHRDVKARNVMRADGGRIVLMDFGAGQVLEGDASRRRAATQGTPIYMAPEALAGRPGSVATDIYSTGVLLFYLVTGRYPVEGPTTEAVERAHARGQRTFVADHRPDLPMAFVRAVEKAVDPDPLRRHASASRLLVDLLASSDALPVGPEPGPSPIQEIWGYLTGDIARAASIVALCVLGSFALGFLNSWAYTYALGIDSSFSGEDSLTWLRSGIKSMVAPLVLMTAFWVLVLVVLEIVALVRRVSSAADRLLTRAGDHWESFVRRAGLTPLNTLALLLVASAAFLAWIVFSRFEGLILAIMTPIDTASSDTLSLLSLSNEPEHNAYRQILSLGTLGMVTGIGLVLRYAARRGERLRPMLLAAMLATTTMTVVLLDFPYRILWHNESEKATFNGESCYVIASRPDAVRLFCPGRTPRLSTVPVADPGLVRSKTLELENIFTTYSRSGRE